MTDVHALERQLLEEARIPRTDWWASIFYKSPEVTTWWDEQLSWKKGVLLWDLASSGGMPWFQVSGPDAARILTDTGISDFTRARTGTVKQYVATRGDGKVIADTMALTLAPGVFELSGWVSPLLYANRNGDYDVTIAPTAPRTAIQVSGPHALELMARFTDAPLDDVRFAHFIETEFAGHQGRLNRVVMSLEPGFEIELPFEAHDEVRNALLEAGHDFGIREIGTRNHLTQHIEGGMPGPYSDSSYALCDPGDPYVQFLAENGDMLVAVGFHRPKIQGSYEPRALSDFYVSPVEFGAGRLVDLGHDFPGRDVIAQELKNPRRARVALEWNNEDVIDVYASMFSDGPAHAEVDAPHFDYMEMPRDPRLPIEASTVRVNGEPVAFTTSRTYLYSYRRMISHCLIPVEHSSPGTEVEIMWGNPGHPQKLIRARVATTPYKPDRARTPKARNAEAADRPQAPRGA